MLEKTEGNIYFDEPLSRHSTLKIGGKATVFVDTDHIPSLQMIAKACANRQIPVLVVGGGSNLLFRDSDFEGVVINTAKLNRMGESRQEDDNISIRVEAGMSLQKLISCLKENGLSGIESLAGIPGTVGGAIAGNAGAFGCEIKDSLVSLTILDNEGNLTELEKKDIVFEYRKAEINDSLMIVSAEMRFKKKEKSDIAGRIQSCINEKKRAQPLSEKSAGCVFKNPDGMFAGKLIDMCGCKGMREGGIEVSAKHANFFINKGNGTSEEFVKLMEKVRSLVRNRFQVEMEPEINIV